MSNAGNRRDFLERDQYLMPWSPGRTVSTAKAAELLFVSESTIRNMIEDGSLQAYKIRPDAKCSHFRILRSSVEENLRRIRADLDMAKDRI